MFLEKHGLLGWLGDRFGDKNGGLIADLASYLLISERNSAQHHPDYAYSHPLLTPDMRIYSDSKVGKLFASSITRDDVIAFTEWWNAKGDKVYISYDSTNKYCQAGDIDIDIIEGGLSKSGVDGLSIFNVSAVLANKGTFENKRPCHIWEYSVNGTTVETSIYEGDERIRFLHIYFSPYRHSVERSEFELMLRKLANELDGLIGKDCSDRLMAKYGTYYDLSTRE